MAYLADILARKSPSTDEVAIVLDPALADAYHEALAARDEARKASKGSPDDEALRLALEDAQDALDAAEEALEPAVVTFRFQALGGDEFEALKNDNQPTKDQRKKALDDGTGTLLWNPDKFPPALVAECSVDPVISIDDAHRMWKDPNWNAGERNALFNCAYFLQSARYTDDLPKGSGTTRS